MCCLFHYFVLSYFPWSEWLVRMSLVPTRCAIVLRNRVVPLFCVHCWSIVLCHCIHNVLWRCCFLCPPLNFFQCILCARAIVLLCYIWAIVWKQGILCRWASSFLNAFYIICVIVMDFSIILIWFWWQCGRYIPKHDPFCCFESLSVWYHWILLSLSFISSPHYLHHLCQSNAFHYYLVLFW